MGRWNEVEALFKKGRPGSAFDRAVVGHGELPREELGVLWDKLPSLFKAMRWSSLDERRRTEFARLAKNFESAASPPEPQRVVGRVAFPVVAQTRDDDRAATAIVHEIREPRDRFPISMAPESALGKTLANALDAARGLLGVNTRFEVTFDAFVEFDGSSLALAVALAAVSRARALAVDERWVATGGLRADGVVESVGGVDRKCALLAEEFPLARLLVPPGGTPAGDERCVEVSSLAEAVDNVFAPDLVEAERELLERIGRHASEADHRPLVGAGLEASSLRLTELQAAYVPAEVVSAQWLAHDRVEARDWEQQIPSLKQNSVERNDLEGKYRALTGHTFQEGAHAEPRQPLVDVVDESKTTIVLGDGGAGKSSALRHLAEKAAARALASPTSPFPLWLPVSSFDPREQRDLETFLLTGMEALIGDEAPAGASLALRSRIRKGAVLLLLDGLNELRDQSNRHRFLDELRAYEQRHRDARIVLTSRAWAYDEHPVFGGEPVRHLCGLTSEQMRQLVAKLAPEADSNETLWRLRRLLPKQERDEHEPVNPLLVILALLSTSSDHPIRHRAELFERVLRRLAPTRDDTERDYWLSLWGQVAERARAERGGARKRHWWRRVLAEVAAGSAWSADQLLSHATEVSGLLRREAGDRLAFFHESFEEYLAAVHLTRDVGALSLSLEARDDPSDVEMISLALARAVLVLDDRKRVEGAALELLARDAPERVNAVIPGIAQAWRDGVELGAKVEEALLTRLARIVVGYPLLAGIELFREMAWHFSEETAHPQRLGGELLDALLAVVEAPAEVSGTAQRSALELASRAVAYDDRARALCVTLFRSEKSPSSLPRTAVALLAAGALSVRDLLPALESELRWGRYERVLNAVHGREKEIARELEGPAPEKDGELYAWRCLQLMVASRPEELLQSLFSTSNDALSTSLERFIAFATARSPGALRCTLEAIESGRRKASAGLFAGASARTIEADIVPWMLRVDAKVIEGLAQSFYRDGDLSSREALVEALREAANGDDTRSAVRAVWLLDDVCRCETAPRGLEKAVQKAARRLIDLVPLDLANELRETLGPKKRYRVEDDILDDLRPPPSEDRLRLLRRVLDLADDDTPESAFPKFYATTPEEADLLRTHLADSLQKGKFGLAWKLLASLEYQSNRPAVHEALTAIVHNAGDELALKAARRLLYSDIVDTVAIRKVLAATRDFQEFHRAQAAIIAGNVVDAEIAQLLLRGLERQEFPPPLDGLSAMLEKDPKLFDLALNQLDDAEPRRVRRAVATVSHIIDQAKAVKHQLVEMLAARMSARPPRPAVVRELQFFGLAKLLAGHQEFESACNALLDVDDVGPDGAPFSLIEALNRSSAGRTSDGPTTVQPRVEAVFRRFLEHDNLRFVLMASRALLDAGLDDDVVRTAIGRALAGTDLERIVAAAFLCELGVDGARLRPLLVALADSHEEFNAFGWGWRARAFLERDMVVRREEVIDGTPTIHVEIEDHIHTLGDAAVQLLSELHAPELVPVLLGHLDDPPTYRTRKAVKTLQALAATSHPTFVDWALAQVAAASPFEGHGLELSDVLLKTEADVPRHLDAMLEAGARTRWEADENNAWFERVVRLAGDDERWRKALDDRLQRPLAFMERAALTTRLLRSGVTSSAIAAAHVSALCEVDLHRAWHWPASLAASTVPLLEESQLLRDAWKSFVASASPEMLFAAVELWANAASEGNPPAFLCDALANAVRPLLSHADPQHRFSAIGALRALGFGEEFAREATRFLDSNDGGDDDHWRILMATALLRSGERAPALAFLDKALDGPLDSSGLLEIALAMTATGTVTEKLRDRARTALAGPYDWRLVTLAGLAEQLFSGGPAGDDEVLVHQLRGLVEGAPGGESKLFGANPATSVGRRGDDPAERILAWPPSLDRARVPVERLARVLTSLAGGTPDDALLMTDLAATHRAADATERRKVVLLGKRRPGDEPVHILARAWLMRLANIG